MSSIKKSSTRRSDDTMDDDSDDKDSKRKSRNLSEKKRRDQFNLLVNELSSMVATGSRKMDKSTVLKSTISFLKNHNEVALRSRANEIQEDWKPTFLTNEEFTHLVLEAVDGFIMVFAATGQIFYVSESITSLLGHLPNEVLNMSIYDLTSEDEHNSLYNILLAPSEQGQASFSCHLRRGDYDAKNNPCFELVHFVGYFRSDEDMVQPENRYSGYSGEADTRLVFVGTGRIQTPRLIREMPLIDSSKSEFTSRHSLEWKFLFLDHRAPPIIGYLPFELLGTSGYDYYHVDDLDNVIAGHEALMQKGEGTSCYYRFLTKGQQWIWLQTRYYITYHQWNSKPEFIVCTHRVVSYEDVMKQNRKEDPLSQISMEAPSPALTLGNDGSCNPWPSKSSKSIIRHGTASDCTSLSADSPTSRHSVMTQHSIMTQHSVKSKSSHSKHIPQIMHSQQSQPSHQLLQQQQQHQQHQQHQEQLQPIHYQQQHHHHQQQQQQHHHHQQQPLLQQQLPQQQQQLTHQQPLPQQQHHVQQQQQQQFHQQPSQPLHSQQPQTFFPPHSQPMQHTQSFLEPPQYVAAIPMQPMISGFSPSTVLSPLPSLDNVIMTPAQTQIQMDLQRKHAELQAIIGQQQAELRRVSEQLLMAKLGLLPHPQNQPLQNVSGSHLQTYAQTPMTYQGTNSETISNTATTVQGMQSGPLGSPSVIVPVTISLPNMPHHQSNLLYNPNDPHMQAK